MLHTSDILWHRRTEYGRMIRKEYDNHKTKASWREIREFFIGGDWSNTITGVQKDNLIYVRSKTYTKHQ